MSARRKPNKKSKRKTNRRKDLRRSLLLVATFIGLSLLLWLAWLDYWAVVKFRERHQVAPAQVYSRPLEWFPRAQLSLNEGVEQLQALGYRKARDNKQPGSYLIGQGFLDVHIRQFRYADGIQKSNRVRIHFKKKFIHKIEQLPSRQSLPVALVDPVELGTIQARSHQDRRSLKLHEVPDGLLKVLLLVEDRHFSSHFGVDPWAIARAMWVNIRSGRMHQGGSTLTQQLVKNLYLTSERTFKRKLKELFYSLVLELHFEKHEILEAYVNEVFLAQSGNRAIHGFALASEYFFSRPLKELELQDFALLVGMVKAPTSYNPVRNPKRAIQRRNVVLQVLKDSGEIDDATYVGLTKKPLGIVSGGRIHNKSHISFLDLVRRQLGDVRHALDDQESITLWSTMEMRVQNAAQSALSTGLSELEKVHGMESGTLQGAVVVLRAESGQVLGVVGDRRAGYAGFNRALDAKRPVGSLLKPALLLSALENNPHFHLGSLVSDDPFSIQQANGTIWTPENYDKKNHGNVTLLSLLENSYNVASARLGVSTGVEQFIKVLGRLGVERSLDPFPSTLLGAVDMSPFEVARLYLPFASGGFGFDTRSFVVGTDPKGRVRVKNNAATHQLIEPQQHYLADFALKGVVQRGTASKVLGKWGKNLGISGKTGTTNNYRDSWFAGYSGNYLTVVWIGRDDNQPMGLSGSSGALRIWKRAMEQLPNRTAEFSVPGQIEWANLETSTGLTSTKECKNSIRIPLRQEQLRAIDDHCSSKRSSLKVLSGIKQDSAKLGGWFKRIFSSGEDTHTNDQESGRR